MKILIVGYFFYPENTPRAFRTHELVKEFLKRGYKVDLVLPEKKILKEATVQDDKLTVHFLGDEKSYSKNVLASKFANQSKLKSLLKKVYRYFNPFTNTYNYISLLFTFLKNHQVKYDLLISISHPFVTHLGTARALRHNPVLNSSTVKVAEYSDPFYFQKNSSMFIGYKYLDLWIGKMFDFIIVPTEIAVSTYLNHKKIDRIKVIPQGFNFEDIEISEYTKHPVPTFAYAGVFYKKIRNPEFFLDYLVNLEMEFKFIIYTLENDMETEEILGKYKSKLGEKLMIHYDVPRVELIRELSTMDFLINIDNSTTNQSPSKLIDYGLSNRPVCSFNQNSFDSNKLNLYFKDPTPFAERINLEKFNIINVADAFVTLK